MTAVMIISIRVRPFSRPSQATRWPEASFFMALKAGNHRLLRYYISLGSARPGNVYDDVLVARIPVRRALGCPGWGKNKMNAGRHAKIRSGHRGSCRGEDGDVSDGRAIAIDILDINCDC